MLKLLFIFIFSFNLLALEISIDSARENKTPYSVLHLKNQEQFLCQEKLNDFKVVTKVICAFKNKPSELFKPIQNDFFKIDTTIKNQTFFIIVKPFFKIKLVPMVFNLVDESSVYTADVKISNYWMIVGYKDKLPLIYQDKKTDMGLNFPFVMKKDTLPFVEGLDLEGRPVHIKKVEDVTDYLLIKKYYKEKKYKKCLDLIDLIMYDYPNSLFRAELLYYKILVYSKLKDYDSVIELSKEYLNEYSASENVPEILSLIAKAYAKNGLSIDADYFFDRLFSEHADSVYKYWGYIYKAEMLEASGGVKKALSFYKKALKGTDNLDVAVYAAYKLAQYYVNASKFKKASTYIMKIIKAKPEFFIEYKKSAIEMMEQFAQEWHYDTAIAIAKALIDKMSKKDDEYEKLLRDRAIWLTKTKNKDEALKALNRYLKEFKYGDYEDEIKMAKDELFFDLDDSNVTYRLKEYDKLIDKYENDYIAKRAIYEKAKLLLKEKRYADVLAIENDLLSLKADKFPDAKDLVYSAAKGLTIEYLNTKECKDSLNLIATYDVKLEPKFDTKLYDCAMSEAEFDFAKDIASKYLKDKDLNKRKEWLFRYLKVMFSKSKYKEVIKISNDLLILVDNIANSKYKEVYRYLFDAYSQLEDNQGMLKTIEKTEKYFGIKYKDIERYVKVVSIGVYEKDNNIIIKYGNIVRNLQLKTKTHFQSPYIEFTLYQAYIDIEDYNMALEIIKSLDDVELTPSQRARQKYLLGSVYSRLWRDFEAKEAYDEAIKADKDSAWAKLAKSAKDI